jgi:hypothetical protein
MGRGAGRMVAVMCTLLACGDDGGAPKYASGIDGRTPLSGLSASDASRLCTSAQTWARDAIPLSKRAMLLCKSGALAAVVIRGSMERPGRLQQVCQQTYAGCIQHSDMAPAAISCPLAGPGCTATVADYEACLNDFPASFDRSLAAIPSCDMLTLDAIFGLTTAASILPPSCVAFKMRCPGARVTSLPAEP